MNFPQNKKVPASKKQPPRNVRKNSSRNKKIVVPGILDQVDIAFRPENRKAAIIGSVFGGVIPVGVYLILKEAVSISLIGGIMAAIAFGGLIVSAITVWQWAASAFNGSKFKATGFVLFLEGTMSTCGNAKLGLESASLLTLSIVILLLLIVINGVAAAVVLTQTKRLT